MCRNYFKLTAELTLEPATIETLYFLGLWDCKVDISATILITELPGPVTFQVLVIWLYVLQTLPPFTPSACCNTRRIFYYSQIILTTANSKTIPNTRDKLSMKKTSRSSDRPIGLNRAMVATTNTSVRIIELLCSFPLLFQFHLPI